MATKTGCGGAGRPFPGPGTTHGLLSVSPLADSAARRSEDRIMRVRA